MSSEPDPERFKRDHRWARGRMSDYLDGNLTPAGRARIERHLHECRPCRRLLDGLRGTVDALHRLPAPTPGVDALTIAASVRGRLAEPD